MNPDLTSAYGGLSRKIKALPFCLFMLLFGTFVPFKAYAETTKFNPILSPSELKNLDPEMRVILDSRSAWVYFFGHIPGAVRIPGWQKFTETQNEVPGLLIRNPDWIAKMLRSLGISKQTVLVVYGDPSDQWRTDGRFFWMFHYYGFDKVALLDGGYDYWVKQGGSVERGPGQPPSPSLLSASDIHFNSNVIADQQWIAQRLDSPNLVLIDNRTQEEYNGATPYGSPRGGHIPNAVHIDWRDFFTVEGILKKPKALEIFLTNNGIKPHREIAVYCTGGVRSGMAYFALKALGFKTRNYDGSWWDWSRNPSLPTVL